MPFFLPDDERLPPELRPLAAALDLASVRPDFHRGWLAAAWPAAPAEPLRPGAPPYDGVYRGSWLSPGVCLRLDLGHPAVPDAVAERLRARHSERIGADGALYRFGVDSTSQRTNRDEVIAWLRRQVAEP